MLIGPFEFIALRVLEGLIAGVAEVALLSVRRWK